LEFPGLEYTVCNSVTPTQINEQKIGSLNLKFILDLDIWGSGFAASPRYEFSRNRRRNIKDRGNRLLISTPKNYALIPIPRWINLRISEDVIPGLARKTHIFKKNHPTATLTGTIRQRTNPATLI